MCNLIHSTYSWRHVLQGTPLVAVVSSQPQNYYEDEYPYITYALCPQRLIPRYPTIATLGGLKS